MEKHEVYIPGVSRDSELHHGGKWSEEAKRRYAEARKAGRSVYDMFGSVYQKSANGVSRVAKDTTKTVNRLGQRVNRVANAYANEHIYKDQIAKAARSANQNRTITNNIRRANRSLEGAKRSVVSKASSIGEAMAKEKHYNDGISSNNRIISKLEGKQRKLNAKLKKSQNHNLAEIARDGSKKLANAVSKAANKTLKSTGKSVDKMVKDGDKTLKSLGRKASRAKHLAEVQANSLLRKANRGVDNALNSAANATIYKDKIRKAKVKTDKAKTLYDGQMRDIDGVVSKARKYITSANSIAEATARQKQYDDEARKYGNVIVGRRAKDFNDLIDMGKSAARRGLSKARLNENKAKRHSRKQIIDDSVSAVRDAFGGSKKKKSTSKRKKSSKTHVEPFNTVTHSALRIEDVYIPGKD